MSTAYTNNKWSKSSTFVTPSGWLITTDLSHTKGESTVLKSKDFTKLDELPDEIQQGLTDGKLTIVTK